MLITPTLYIATTIHIRTRVYVLTLSHTFTVSSIHISTAHTSTPEIGRCMQINSFSASLATVLVCDRPNEEYRCGSACQTTCATLGQTCPIVNIRCNDDCYCEEGYARDCRGRCIPIKQCPGRGCKSRKRIHPKDTLIFPREYSMSH